MNSMVTVEPDELGMNSSDIKIEKSSSNIHQTVDPTKKITATQAKALNAVQYKLQVLAKEYGLSASQFHQNHPGNLIVTMASQEFRRLINCESRNTAYLRKIMDEIKNLSATEDTLDGTGKGRIAFRNLFIAAEYTDSTFKFEVPEETTKLLVTDVPAAIIDVLTVANSLSSKYAVFMNDLLEEWSYKEGTDDFKIVVDDARLRNLMKIPFKMNGRTKVYSYPQPAILKRKAIDPAVSEINEANLRFEISNYTHMKKDGKLYWYFDVISKKTMLVHQFSVKNAFEIADTKQKLRDLRVSEEAIRTIISSMTSDYDLAYVQYNIDIVEQQAKRGRAANAGGLFISCMERNKEQFEPIWQDMKVQREADKAFKRNQYEAKLAKDRKARIEELVELTTQVQLDRLIIAPQGADALVDDFIAHLSNIPMPAAKALHSELVVDRQRKDFIKSPLFYKYLQDNVRKNLSSEEIEHYIRSKGSSIHV